MNEIIRNIPRAVQRDDEPERPKLKSSQLLRGRRKITIEHDGAEYVLQLTKQNKLLLTK